MKFYEFKNVSEQEGSLYIYGEIISGGNEWKWDETDVTLTDFKQQLDDLGDIKTLNMYINSPGGSVFVASTMISMLERLKAKGTVINTYVDGLSASAASFLMMIADNIYLYKNSIVMIHRPMAVAMGNVDDMQSMIDTLNKIEDSILVPMYLNKAKKDVDEKKIKTLLANETWLNASDMSKYFNVELIEDSKQIAAFVDVKLFKNYKNTPKELIEEVKDTVNEDIENEETKMLEIKNKEILEKAKAKLKLIATL